MLRIALTLLCLMCVNSARAGWFGYDSYEDCMLGRMKGQDRSLYRSADKLCKRQFKIKTPISPSLVKWRAEIFHDYIHLSMDNWPDEYEQLSGKFIFSKKPCPEAKDADFGLPANVEFNKDGDGIAYVEPEDGACIRAITFMGLEK